ncbi:MAG: glycosyltransferase family 2 protein [Eubacteriales bacterium]|nr:glycosyltransferase family 2 protein [Eubacteriales bacterium]
MISVALAAFNGRHFIEAQVASILVQLSATDELVVADNGSSDGTWTWLEVMASTDSRVRIFQNTKTHGVIANFEFAIMQCRGDVIFLSDQDDLWLDGKVSKMTEALFSTHNLLLVQSDARLIDETDQVIEPSFFALRRSGPGIIKNFIRNTYQGCTLAFRRELLDLALPFPPYLPMHDMWLGILAESVGDVLFMPDCLTAYRRHRDNRSGLSPRETRQILSWRLDLAWALFRRWPTIRQIKKQGRVTR